MAGIGRMTLNGRTFKNRITDWGLSAMLRSMFEDVPLPQLYIAVIGYTRDISQYPGLPSPYSTSLPADSVGTFIGNTEAKWSIEYDEDGLPIAASIPPIIEGQPRSCFEFVQSTPLRAKLSPLVITDTHVQSEPITFSCFGADDIGGNVGDFVYICLVDEETLYNNNAMIFSKAMYLNYDLSTGNANTPLPHHIDLSSNATFTYSFDLD